MIVVVQHYYMREVFKRKGKRRYRVNVLTAGELLLADDDDLDSDRFSRSMWRLGRLGMGSRWPTQATPTRLLPCGYQVDRLIRW